MAGGHAWQGACVGGGCAWQILRVTVNERAVRILLECILVSESAHAVTCVQSKGNVMDFGRQT